jgi:excinuclease ABC subunit C
VSFDPAELLAGLPSLPGVYRFRNAAGDVIYVGKAGDLKKRVSSYFQKTHASPRTTMMASQIAGAETTVTRTEAEALLLENNLIKSLAPRYNVLFRDDKSYGYILITGHEYPQIRFYRGAHTKGNRYFGPFPSAWSSRETIGHLQRIFLLRTCDDTVFAHRSRPCLLHQIRRCSAPCVNLVSVEDYNRDVDHAAQFLEGKETDVINDLTAKMNAAAEALDYEQAAHHRDQIRMLQRIVSGQAVESTGAGDSDIVVVVERENVWCVTLAMVRGGRHLGDRSFFPQNASGSDANTVVEAFLEQHYAAQPIPGRVVCDQLETPPEMEATLSNLAGRPVKVISRPVGESRTWLDMARQNASLAIGQRLSAQATQEARVAALQEFLAAEQPVGRIECFDISHTMGEAPIASCVVYDRGAMQNSEYRRYNVKGVEPGDDYGAMRFALEKRYRKLADGEGGKTPDLILIDGGLGQLNAARAVMTDLGLHQLRMIGVAKGVERKPGMEQLFIAGEEEPKRLPPDHPALHLIQQVRDEAHRFAITGHRARRG